MRPATYVLTLSATQLNVVRDAVLLAAAAGRGSFGDIQAWWGDQGGHGGALRGQLEAMTKKCTGLHPRRIADAPEPAKVAWDVGTVICHAQAAMRLRRSPDFTGLARHSQEPSARLDCLHSGDRSSQGSLKDLEAVPVSLQRVLPPLPRAAPVPKEHPMSVAKKVSKKPVTALVKKAKKK
ncbi:MAG TPA: hypothetical protein PLS53_10935 [Thermoanaerobaculaceae bacterium]|nr:hypothetical protein [Thermoanaerobaculaceae bacterium]